MHEGTGQIVKAAMLAVSLTWLVYVLFEGVVPMAAELAWNRWPRPNHPPLIYWIGRGGRRHNYPDDGVFVSTKSASGDPECVVIVGPAGH